MSEYLFALKVLTKEAAVEIRVLNTALIKDSTLCSIHKIKFDTTTDRSYCRTAAKARLLKAQTASTTRN